MGKHGKTHYKWPFSIATWNYQRVCQDSDFFHDFYCASRDVQLSRWLRNDFSISYCNMFQMKQIPAIIFYNLTPNIPKPYEPQQPVAKWRSSNQVNPFAYLSTVITLFICLVTGHGLYKTVEVFTLISIYILWWTYKKLLKMAIYSGFSH